MGTKNNPGRFDCFQRLQPDEPYFVLMGRDKMASQLVEMWAVGALLKLSSEIEEAKSKGATIKDIEVSPQFAAEYEKITEAKQCARAMADHCLALGKVPMKWNAKPPVINVACDVTKEEVERALFAMSENDTGSATSVIERMARSLRIIP